MTLPFEDLPPGPIKVVCEFDEFWNLYPRKVGKLKAITAYNKALKIASHDEIMAGVRHYIQTKPGYADWAHPPTWLNAGRWMDEPDSASKPDPDKAWQHKAAMAKSSWGRHNVTRQDKEELHRLGLLTDDEMEESL